MSNKRTPDHPIASGFLDRGSPRAYDASAMPTADRLAILEAARWAHSAYNGQPWRFLYSRRDDTCWRNYLSLLDAVNESWARHAAALVIIMSDTVMPGDGERPERKSRSHSFDAGAAWAQLALQATLLGYQAHAMAGIDFDKSHKVLAVPDRYRIEVAIAIGKTADKSELPKELQDREEPSQRFSVGEIAFAGVFPQ